MTIYIDSRVGSKELEKYIPVRSVVTTLQYGDIAFLGNGPNGACRSIGIERKTINDLVSSMTSARLSGHQLIGMLQAYDYVYLLIEGIWRANPSDGLLEIMKSVRGKRGFRPVELGKRRFTAREVWNYVNTLAVQGGMFVWHAENIGQSGRWIAALYGWWNKDWESHKSIHRGHTQSPPHAMLIKPTLTHRMVKEIPGIGWDKGKAVATSFPTMEKLLAADEKDLARVPGIGKKLAKEIWRSLREVSR